MTDDRIRKSINGVDFVFIAVPPGKFTMGSRRSSDEYPLVIHDMPKFWVQSTPLTRIQWTAIGMPTSPWEAFDSRSDPSLPVGGIDWFEARACGDLVRKSLDVPVDLIGDAEYEYVARAGVQSDYPWGAERDMSRMEREYDMLDMGSHQLLPESVCHKEPNPWGLYAMIGCSLIWTRDIIAYGPEWPALPRRAWPKKSKGEAICAPDGEQRIVRGVINSACEPFAHRIITVPDERSQDYGLRLVIRALALLSCVLLSSFGFAADLVPATAAPSAAVRIDLGATTEPPDWFVVLQGVDAGYFRRSLERSAGDVDATVATLEELTAGLETFCSQRRHTAVTISAMWSLCDPVFLTEMIKAGRETMEFINDDHEVVPNAAARAEIARRIRKVQAVLQSVRKESLDRLVGATTAPLVQVQKP